MIQVVSENSDQELARRRAEQAATYAIRALTANLIRITRGAGKPYEIGPQISALVEAMQAHRDAANCWPYNEMADALRIEQSRDWMARSSEDEIERFYAKEAMIAGALQIIASRLMGQRTQETAGDHELWSGVNQVARIWERREAAARAEARAARARKPKTKKKAPRKPNPKPPA